MAEPDLTHWHAATDHFEHFISSIHSRLQRYGKHLRGSDPPRPLDARYQPYGAELLETAHELRDHFTAWCVKHNLPIAAESNAPPGSDDFHAGIGLLNETVSQIRDLEEWLAVDGTPLVRSKLHRDAKFWAIHARRRMREYLEGAGERRREVHRESRRRSWKEREKEGKGKGKGAKGFFGKMAAFKDSVKEEMARKQAERDDAGAKKMGSDAHYRDGDAVFGAGVVNAVRDWNKHRKEKNANRKRYEEEKRAAETRRRERDVERKRTGDWAKDIGEADGGSQAAGSGGRARKDKGKDKVKKGARDDYYNGGSVKGGPSQKDGAASSQRDDSGSPRGPAPSRASTGRPSFAPEPSWNKPRSQSPSPARSAASSSPDDYDYESDASLPRNKGKQKDESKDRSNSPSPPPSPSSSHHPSSSSHAKSDGSPAHSPASSRPPSPSSHTGSDTGSEHHAGRTAPHDSDAGSSHHAASSAASDSDARSTASTARTDGHQAHGAEHEREQGGESDTSRGSSLSSERSPMPSSNPSTDGESDSSASGEPSNRRPSYANTEQSYPDLSEYGSDDTRPPRRATSVTPVPSIEEPSSEDETPRRRRR